MKRQPSILQVLASRSFRRSRGRNLAAALAIFLTTMMFTTLLTLTQSMEQNMTELYFRQAGTQAHASCKQITDAQLEQIASHPAVASWGKSIVVGLGENQGLAGRQLEIRYASDQYARDGFAYPSTGKMPEQENEIALDTLTLTRLGIPAELGQPVTLEWRQDLNSPERISSTFTLCGWWEGNQSVYASMAWVSEEFALKACGGREAPADGQICGLRMMGVTFANSKGIEEQIASVLQDCGLEYLEFTANMAYWPETQQSIFMENLPMYGGMLLVFLAGYLIIYNVFQISVASDIQFYGRLKTLGATTKQIKKLIFAQGNRLSLIGIPFGLIAGYLLGIALVPALLSTLDTVSVSASPLIFAGSAAFAYGTVLISCLLPARLAGRVPPIEALRCTDADSGIKRKRRQTRGGAFLPAMAWANLWRSRKRTVLVLCSLTLGLVLMSFFYAKNASFDVEKYLVDMAVADYEIDDATNSAPDGYEPDSRTICADLLSDIEALEPEAEGRLYSRQMELSLSKQARQNLSGYYTAERLESFAAYDPTFPVWKEGFGAAIAGQSVPCTIYGADGLILDATADVDYLLDGVFDREAFDTGGYCLAIGPAIEPGRGIPTWSVGETVSIGDREFEVMAVLSPLQPMVAGASPAFDLPLVLSAEAFLELWPESNLRKFYFNVPDSTLEPARSLLTEYQQTAAAGMNMVSRQTMVEQYEAETRSAAVMGYAVSAVIALVGILNFVNSMVTAILSRKREFAMIQSIGMTKCQLRSMLTLEGLYYAGLTLIASCVLGAVAVGVVVRSMAGGGFSTFRFTLFPLAVCAPILLLFAVLIPYFCFQNLEKQSVVERLRTAD